MSKFDFVDVFDHARSLRHVLRQKRMRFGSSEIDQNIRI